jgi:uncharacterized protein (DUF305 family)
MILSMKGVPLFIDVIGEHIPDGEQHRICAAGAIHQCDFALLLDALFIRLMTIHHAGAVKMADDEL